MALELVTCPDEGKPGQARNSKKPMTHEEYKQTLIRLEKGEKIILEHGGFMQAPKKWTDEYQRLADACLMYEVDNDLIPEL